MSGPDGVGRKDRTPRPVNFEAWAYGRRMTFLGYGTPTPHPYEARLSVGACLEARGLSAYQVAMSGLAQGTIDRGTAYRLIRGDVKRLDLHSLEVIAGIIHALTGQPVTLGELLSLKAGKP